jgi:hypothetical protein
MSSARETIETMLSRCFVFMCHAHKYKTTGEKPHFAPHCFLRHEKQPDMKILGEMG